LVLKKIERKISYLLKRLTEYPLQPLNDKLNNSDTSIYTIPKNVYQTWENNLFGKTHFKELVNFRNLNSNYNFFIFDKDKRDQYMEQHWSKNDIYQVYKKARFGQIKADIFRYCILYERGGFYFDISKGCNVCLDELYNSSSEAVISNEPIECIIPPDQSIFSNLKYPWNNFLQWGLGFKKNHTLLKMVIEAISKDHQYYVNTPFHKPKTAVLSLSATGQFTKIVREYFKIYGFDKVEQVGIYFNNHGIFSMKGSRVRHHLVKEYADIRDDHVL